MMGIEAPLPRLGKGLICWKWGEQLFSREDKESVDIQYGEDGGGKQPPVGHS